MKAIPALLFLAILAVVLAGCNTASEEKEKIYDVKGKVVSLAPEKKSVRLDHEAIPGWMRAMEMDFPVQDAKLLDGLKVGDAVQGKVKVKGSNYVITDLQKN